MPDTPELPPLPEPDVDGYYVGASNWRDEKAWDAESMRDYARAAILADRATRLAAAPKGWIAVEDRRPEVGTDCLVWVITQGGWAKVDRWDEQREAPIGWSSATIPVGDGWDDSDYEDVTHWMPLPPAPDAAPAASSPASLAPAVAGQTPQKLWLWRNFVDGRPEYWAFDNPYPINPHDDDPQTLGEPCGYAIFKPSRQGRTDWTEEQVLSAMKRAKE